ncbi:MAG: hypothetical protein LC104_06420 [Bacteroidales bacterium]|nr:hypothetical protein [Bacteroidales bacterium]
MSNIILTSKSDADRKLHLEIPVDAPDTEFEVEVAVRQKSPGCALPPDYFSLIGSINDDTFFRHPQGPLPDPVELD